jgi:hypothetical protein
MLTILWLSITTISGYWIDHIWFLESADWIGTLIGFAIGVILWLLTHGGPGSGIGDAFSGFDDFGGSD